MSLSPASQEKVKHDMQKSNQRVAELQSIQRDLTVTEIASKFKGKSLVESRVQFERKQSQITQKDRLLMRAIFYFQANKRESLKGRQSLQLKASAPAASYKINNEEEVKLPEALSKLQSFWTTNRTTPTKGVSHRSADIQLDLSPRRTPTFRRVSTKDFEEELAENGISRNTLCEEDWEHWQKAIASAVEDQKNGEFPEISPMNSISIDEENELYSRNRNNSSFSEVDEKLTSSFSEERLISPLPSQTESPENANTDPIQDLTSFQERTSFTYERKIIDELPSAVVGDYGTEEQQLAGRHSLSPQRRASERWQRIVTERDSDDEYEAEPGPKPIETDNVEKEKEEKYALSQQSNDDSKIEKETTNTSTVISASNPVENGMEPKTTKEDVSNPQDLLKMQEKPETHSHIQQPSQVNNSTATSDSSTQGLDYLFYTIMLLVLLRIFFELWTWYSGEVSKAMIGIYFRIFTTLCRPIK